MSSSKYKSNPITKIVKLTFWTIISLYHKIIFNSVKGYLICYIQYIRGSTVKQIAQFLKSYETFIFYFPEVDTSLQQYNLFTCQLQLEFPTVRQSTKAELVRQCDNVLCIRIKNTLSRREINFRVPSSAEMSGKQEAKQHGNSGGSYFVPLNPFSQKSLQAAKTLNWK